MYGNHQKEVSVWFQASQRSAGVPYRSIPLRALVFLFVTMLAGGIDLTLLDDLLGPHYAVISSAYCSNYIVDIFLAG